MIERPVPFVSLKDMMAVGRRSLKIYYWGRWDVPELTNRFGIESSMTRKSDTLSLDMIAETFLVTFDVETFVVIF
jgi:hypothetical protein